VIDETLFDAEEKMEKAVGVAKDDLASVRTGRATPNMFSRVVVDYYGAMTPLNQLSSINIPEARMAIIKPYDASQLRTIEKAIRDSDLGLNPSNDGQIIRVPVPALTQDRRKELVKLARKAGEDAKVRLRHVRREYNDIFKNGEKGGEISEDESRRLVEKVQTVTDKYVAQVDQLVTKKEEEVLEV
jgi:ribosome recycling factor